MLSFPGGKKQTIVVIAKPGLWECYTRSLDAAVYASLHVPPRDDPRKTRGQDGIAPPFLQDPFSPYFMPHFMPVDPGAPQKALAPTLPQAKRGRPETRSATDSAPKNSLSALNSRPSTTKWPRDICSSSSPIELLRTPLQRNRERSVAARSRAARGSRGPAPAKAPTARCSTMRCDRRSSTVSLAITL